MTRDEFTACAAAIVFGMFSINTLSATSATEHSQSREATSLSGDRVVDESYVRPIGELLFAESVTPDEMSELAFFLDAPAYYVSPSGITIIEAEPGSLWAVGESVLTDGTRLSFADTVDSGESIASGVLFNAGPEPVLIRIPNREDSVREIPTGSLVGVGGFVETGGQSVIPVPGDQCSVTCGAGFYACCCCISGTGAVCSCVNPNNPPHCNPCRAGGPGSTGCSIQCNIAAEPAP